MLVCLGGAGGRGAQGGRVAPPPSPLPPPSLHPSKALSTQVPVNRPVPFAQSSVLAHRATPGLCSLMSLCYYKDGGAQPGAAKRALALGTYLGLYPGTTSLLGCVNGGHPTPPLVPSLLLKWG